MEKSDEFIKDKQTIGREARMIREGIKTSVVSKNYGICNKCTNFIYLERELDTHVGCEQKENLFSMDSRNPVVKCSYFDPIGVLDINTMWSIAKILDLEDPKMIGFGIGDKNKLKVREPKGKLRTYYVSEDD